MKSTLTFAVLLPLLARCRLVLTSPIEAPAPGPGPIPADAVTPATLADAIFVPLQYVGPITPGGNDVSLNDTAQEIHAQIHELNPAFRPADFPALDPRAPAPRLGRRNKLAPWCDPPGIGRASFDATSNNILYLQALPGRCRLQAGPRVCTRLACTEGGGVFLCNDERIVIDPSCAYLASYVLDVMSACCEAHRPWLADCYAAGQVFDTDGYNVIVSAQDC